MKGYKEQGRVNLDKVKERCDVFQSPLTVEIVIDYCSKEGASARQGEEELE